MPQTCAGISHDESGPRRTAPSPVSVIVAITPSRTAGCSRERPALIVSARDRLDAGDQFVDRLFNRNLLAHDPVHRLGPGVLVVEDRELVVLGEVERQRAASELRMHGL